MTYLHQIVAIERNVKNGAERDFTELHKASLKDALYGGILKTYEPSDDAGERLPTERTLVQQNAEEILDQATKILTRLFDITLTKDVANLDATADLVVDGVTYFKQAPVPFLLFLEQKLIDLRTFVSKLPEHDPAETWTHNGAPGVYETAGTETTRSKKIPKAFEKVKATDKFPAQVDTYYEDVIVGRYTTKKFSGRIPEARKAAILSRIDHLSEAVKFAREQANRAEIVDQKVGKALFEYLLAE